MTHYDNLGLEVTASDDEITDAYRSLVKVVHPDAGGDAVMFGILTESFDVLSDPDQRIAYDRLLMEEVHSVAQAPTAVGAHEPLSLFDQVALDSYEQGGGGTVADIVTGCLSTYFVVRFVLYPCLLVGGIMMLVPFLPVQILGGVVVLCGLASPAFVAHGARTTRKKERRRPKP